MSFPVPRYLLVSQSSIPALQAMWKLSFEGTLATLRPLEAPIWGRVAENDLQAKIIIFQ